MKLKMSPPMSQTQHLNDCRSGIHLQAGAGVVVPGANRLVAAALAPQLQIAADQIDDVDCLANPLFIVKRRSERHEPTPWNTCGGRDDLTRSSFKTAGDCPHFA